MTRMQRIADEARRARALSLDALLKRLPPAVPRPAAIWLFVLALGLLVLLLLVAEMRTSWLQARVLGRLAGAAEFSVKPGPSPSIRFPDKGPYDLRRGYSQLPEWRERLQARGYVLAEQARLSSGMQRLDRLGLFLPYPEKSQAGLTLLDCRERPQYAARFPLRVYPSFEAVPPLLVDALLFVENRELLDPDPVTRNPAIEWRRLGKALMDALWSLVNRSHPTPGASTLATQIEKYRHSPGGRTASAGEKLRQMASASVRAYQDGPDTRQARRRIVVDYLNSMPLAARSGYGEVHGLGDGLWAWYGRDFAEVARELEVARRPDATPEQLRRPAATFKQALSLFIAQRRPSHYLLQGLADLQRQTDSYLRLLARADLISPQLRDAALPVMLRFQPEVENRTPFSFVHLKAQTALRTHLGELLAVPRPYELDRFDLSATTTLNRPLQDRLAAVLQTLRDPAQARAKGLFGFHLLQPGDDPGKLIVSFTLFERGADANRLRVQVDNFDQPFDLNQGARLDLGSTAKLRALVHYLEVIAELHQRYAGSDAATLKALPVHERDALTRWAVGYLSAARDRSLTAMLEAAMDRRYSASPWERFFTGGGLHSFENFEPEDNARVMNLRDAFSRSVNLVFIRLMRDLVRYYIYQPGGAASRLLADADDPRRHEYLARFADHEGRNFLSRFYRKYQGKTPEEVDALLMDGIHRSPRRLAAAGRTLMPEATAEQIEAFVRRYARGVRLSPRQLQTLYRQFDPETMSLADRAYVAGVHPLELWLVGYLRKHPAARFSDAVTASKDQRQAAYAWLFRSGRKQAQDSRIEILLELDAFRQISASWRRLGYPFEALTPSYASAIGAAGDRPGALADLVGVLLNDGVKLPTLRVEQLHFAEGTPYETRYAARPGSGQRLLPPEVARVARQAMLGVVERGTAMRLHGALRRADGSAVPIGGKTGTGDHRFEVYGRGGRLLSARVLNRSATFVFLIDDRYFGTFTAYVPQPYAARYRFTSALPVQLLATMAGELQPLLGPPGGEQQCPAAGLHTATR